MSFISMLCARVIDPWDTSPQYNQHKKMKTTETCLPTPHPECTNARLLFFFGSRVQAAVTPWMWKKTCAQCVAVLHVVSEKRVSQKYSWRVEAI